MSRRIDTYSEGFGFDFWNAVATIGAFMIALGTLTFLYNVWKSKREAAQLPPPGPDPWDARSLEWSISSPAPAHNFDHTPAVHGLDEWWHTKYVEHDDGRIVKVADREELAQKGDATGVHLPAPSFWPLVVAVGLPLIGYGVIFNLWLCVVGGLLTAGGVYSWAMEPVDDPDAEPHGHGHDGDGDGGGPDPDDELHPYGPDSHEALPDGSTPEGFTIKGNEDSGLYHRPDSRVYQATVAEVWFRTAEAAEAAGFTLAGTHPALEAEDRR